MKKVLVAITALFCSLTSFAQYSSGGFSLDEENLYWGVRFGVTGASLGGDLDLGMKAGMTLGGVVGLRASDSTPVFIESGLYYTERGGKSGDLVVPEGQPLAAGTYSVSRVGYNCLEIPLLIKYGIRQLTTSQCFRLQVLSSLMPLMVRLSRRRLAAMVMRILVLSTRRKQPRAD